LMNVARNEFENVVVDLGSQLEMMETAAYREASTVYLVTQSGIPELRNANRLINSFSAGAVPKLEIVLNRFESADRACRRNTLRRANQAGAMEDSERLRSGAEHAD